MATTTAAFTLTSTDLMDNALNLSNTATLTTAGTTTGITETTGLARKKLASASLTDLVTAGDNAGDIKSVLLANVHATDANNVDLMVYNNYETHYIVKNVLIPSGTSLEIDLAKYKVNTQKGKDSLRIKCSSANGVDVIINN